MALLRFVILSLYSINLFSMSFLTNNFPSLSFFILFLASILISSHFDRSLLALDVNHRTVIQLFQRIVNTYSWHGKQAIRLIKYIEGIIKWYVIGLVLYKYMYIWMLFGWLGYCVCVYTSKGPFWFMGMNVFFRALKLAALKLMLLLLPHHEATTHTHRKKHNETSEGRR